MAESKESLHKENSLLKNVLVALFFLLTGFGLLGLASVDFGVTVWKYFPKLFEKIGAVLLAVGIVDVLWEYARKQSFLHEIRTAIIQTDAPPKLGIEDATDSFHDDVPWAKLFENSKKKTISVAFAYGGTWRGMNEARLKDFIKDGGTLAVYLPDAEDENVLTCCAQLFSKSTGDMKERILGSEKFFADLRNSCPKASKRQRSVQIYRVKKLLTFSAYVFETHTIYSFYTHSKEKGRPPALVCSKGGVMSRYVMHELDTLRHESTAKLYEP
ncbi:MAG: hypothetical protein WCK51_06550 [Armatimonadota bacterium]